MFQSVYYLYRIRCIWLSYAAVKRFIVVGYYGDYLDLQRVVRAGQQCRILMTGTVIYIAL